MHYLDGAEPRCGLLQTEEERRVRFAAR